jgi:hypothetical protein
VRQGMLCHSQEQSSRRSSVSPSEGSA